MNIKQKLEAPWTDYKGNKLFLGDKIQHPDGTIGVIVLEKKYKDRYSPGFGVDYGDEILNLNLQIGDKGQAVKIGCEHCIDPTGDSCYPYYALKPHRHDLDKTGSFIGSTIMEDNIELPNNFKIDPDNSDFGTYMYCPKCGVSV